MWGEPVGDDRATRTDTARRFGLSTRGEVEEPWVRRDTAFVRILQRLAQPLPPKNGSERTVAGRMKREPVKAA